MDTSSMEMYQVYFVLEPGKTEKSASRFMRNAFASMESSLMEPSWMPANEALTFKGVRKALFVCDPFEGKAFDHLSASSRQIVGPLCIEYCLQSGDSLPNRPYPVYSTCLRKVVATCTDINTEERRELAHKVQLMGGQYVKDLTVSVTHLVAGRVGSKKYRAAADYKIPVVLPDWITQCWTTEQYKGRNAAIDVAKVYICPPFSGLTITVSQVEGDERKKIQKLATDYGATYLGRLKLRETTHVVLLEPQGDKYRFASLWKIPCVRPSWIYDSIKKRCCLDEEDYLVRDGDPRAHDSSTPEKKGLGSRDAAFLPDCSTIANVTMKSTVDDTVMSDISLLPVQRPPARRGTTHSMETYNVNAIPKGGQFLDGCRIYPCGFAGTHLEKIQRIINAGGGTRYSKFTDSVTHVVVSDTSDIDSFPFLRDADAHIVTVQWLLSCCENRSLVDETPNLCFYKIPLPSSPNGSPASKSKSVEAATRNDFETANCTAGVDYNELMKQYAPVGDIEDRPCSSTVALETINSTKDTVDEANVPEADSSSVFGGMAFCMVGFEQKDSLVLAKIVQSNGGIVVDPERETNFAIVPLLGSTAVPNAKNVATNCWLQMCSEQEECLDLDGNPLFKQIGLKLDCTPLANCVLSISQFAGTERDSLMHLAEVLGATCQEYLVRVANKRTHLLPNTHLVLETPEGQKYEAARKWNLPAVTKFWLVETALTGVKAREEDFLVNKSEDEKTVAAEQITRDDETDFSAEKPQPEIATIDSLLDKVPLDVLCISADAKEDPQVPVIEEAAVSSDGKETTGDSGIQNMAMDENGDFLDSNSDFRANLKLDDVLADLDSPSDMSTLRRRSSIVVRELMTRNLKKLVKSVGIDTTFTEEPLPLAGVILCLAKKLEHRDLVRICSDLGGDYRWSYDKGCTHFVFQGKSSDASKELRVARSQGKMIVSPDWLYACRDERRRVDEALYPFTFNPRRSILSQVGSNASQSCFVAKEVERERSESTTGRGTTAYHPADKEEDGNFGISSEAAFLDVSKQVTELMLATNSAKAERCLSRRMNSSSESSTPTESATKIKARLQSKPVEFEPQPSQSVPITWDDPMGRMEQERITEQVSHCTETQATQEVGQLIQAPAEIGDEDRLPQVQRKFSFSGLKDNEKNHFSGIIRSLGGLVSDSRTHDLTSTHLISSALLKNEKFLSSVALGKWVLRKSYLEECERQMRFVEEESHEWGHGDGSTTPQKLVSLSLCPRRWRLHVAENGTPAFYDWRVVVHSEPGSKMETFRRILTSGGAVVLPAEYPYCTTRGATLALVDNSKGPVRIDYGGYEEASVRCVRADYLAAYLVDSSPQIESYVVNQSTGSASNSSLSRKRKTDRNAKSPKRNRF